MSSRGWGQSNSSSRGGGWGRGGGQSIQYSAKPNANSNMNASSNTTANNNSSNYRGNSRGRGGRGGHNNGPNNNNNNSLNNNSDKPRTHTAHNNQRAKRKPAVVIDYTQPYKGLEKIVSGGETGADRAGLEAGKELGIATGGYALKGFKTEIGNDPSLADLGVEEDPHIHGFADLSSLNAESADGTIAFRLHDSKGTDRTIGYCFDRKYSEEGSYRIKSSDWCYKPVLIITSLDAKDQEKNETQIRNFIIRNQIRVVNIAGHRESTAGMDKFGEKVQLLLVGALTPVIKPNVESLEKLKEQGIQTEKGEKPAQTKEYRYETAAKFRQFVVNSKKSKDYDVYIGRPSQWGNPFVIGKDGDRFDVCRKFEEWILTQPKMIAEAKQELAGKRIGCFCAPLQCHGETLARIANSDFGAVQKTNSNNSVK